ncbi:Inner membrane protein YrbG [Pseudovibrio axinellae]|uniref:Inner membrane protein YrbG n=1 Tax=Pseudovibrio axinellae TaxID=989403 RepID=A0A161XI23_9HYPH|nr:calcium/sodium antiporter [Pseudovibrio axinellae]KZL21593.1 Inner membrane protein YrbG [Pseudovibrio axinellae]SER10899.1 cation:H+ antiporter [Pseudovibrio axinellae]
MLFSYAALLGGLALLIFAGDLLVRGAVSIAQALGIPTLVIGLTIVAFGTSAPELFISLKAALDGVSGVAIGNVVGSNIANVLLVLGVPALIAATPCNESGAQRNALFMLVVSVIFTALCFMGTLNFYAGIALLALLLIFLADSVRATKKHRKENRAGCKANETEEDELDVESVPENKAIAAVFLILGLIGLPLGAQLTITGATDVASSWGVSDAVIGLTVVALGTSLPELATTVMAAIRKHSGVALGNVIGSNVFNLLAIMGITVTVIPIPVPEQILVYDIWVMLACALLLYIIAAKRLCLGKVWGICLTAAYVAYIYVVFALDFL